MPETPTSLLGQIQANTTGGVVNRYPPKLGFIGDVDGTPATNGQFLEYDTSRGLWVPHTLAAADIGDFDLTGLSTDDSLIWNGTDFVRFPPGAAIAEVGSANNNGTSDTWARGDHVHAMGSIDDASNVDLASLVTDDMLIYNGTNFVRTPPAAAVSVGTANSAGTLDTWSRSDHVHANANLDSLTDVVITAAATGELLRYNGTNWVDDRAALDDLSDVTITSVAAEDELRWNGSAWVNDQAWTTYSAAWTAATTNPTIGNGTISDGYRRRGDTVTFRVAIIMGSTTTFGSGDYFVSLPVGASASIDQMVPCWLVDSGTTNYIGVLVFGLSITDGAKGKIITHNNANAASSTVPFTFAANDRIVIEGSYQAA